jgi:hypothetical protein
VQLVKFALYFEITTRVIAAETALGGEHVSLAAEHRVIKFEFRQTAPSAESLAFSLRWHLLGAAALSHFENISGADLEIRLPRGGCGVFPAPAAHTVHNK